MEEDQTDNNRETCTCPPSPFSEGGEKCTCEIMAKYGIDKDSLCTCANFCNCSQSYISGQNDGPQDSAKVQPAPISITIHDSFANSEEESSASTAMLKQMRRTCGVMEETMLVLKTLAAGDDDGSQKAAPGRKTANDKKLRAARPDSATRVNRDLVSSSPSFHLHETESVVLREYMHQVLVELKATYLKILDVDTLNQQYEAEVFVQAKWEEPAFSGWPQNKLDLLTPADIWEPFLIILNSVGEFDQERRSYIVRYEEGYEAPVVLNRWRFKSLFREPLELRHFPFDVQDLSLLVSTERSLEEVKLKHDLCQLSSVNTYSFQDSGEWNIYKHVECTQQVTNMEYASATVHPILKFQCRVRRKVWYFIWNIIFIVSLVLILSLLTIPVESTTSDRLSNTMTLFLTMVAFKLVVKQSLPTISYLTYLDFYVLGSMIYLVLFATENATIMTLSHWMDPKLLEDWDTFFCMLLVSLLLLFHIVFIVHIHFVVLRRHRQMIENDRNYVIQAKLLAQSGGKSKKTNLKLPPVKDEDKNKAKTKTATFVNEP